jgi:hypothetical protein
VIAATVVGLAIGVINGYLVTTLRVPAFIATLTMLFIGRGLVLGLTGGKTISYEQKSRDPWFFMIGANNALGFDNQILVFVLVAILGMIALAKTRLGYETYAVGGNEQAARLCRHRVERGAAARLSAVLGLRDAGRADERRAGQGHHLAIRPGRRAGRHRRGDRRRCLRSRAGAGACSARAWVRPSSCSSTRCCARACR